MRNEITDLILEELDKYGLKGQISDRSKHLEVSWQLSSGEGRFIIVPRTPSDWRSGMNARSDLRKMLRKDGVELKQEPSTSFKHAMSLPKESIVTIAARERALQKDVETLCEIVLELQDNNATLLSQVSTLVDKLNSVQVTSTVMSNVSFVGQAQQVVEQPALQPEVKPLFRKERVTSKEVVYNLLGYDWTPVAVVKERSGLNPGVVNQCLMRLRKRGLVESGLRGQWRKTPHDNVVLLGSGNQSSA